jgi:hypothetical protein
MATLVLDWHNTPVTRYVIVRESNGYWLVVRHGVTLASRDSRMAAESWALLNGYCPRR